MEFQNFYYISQGVFGVLGSIFLLVLTAVIIVMAVKLNRLSKTTQEIAEKVNDITANGVVTSKQMQMFVERMSVKIETATQDFLTFKSAEKLTENIIKALRKNK
jgi:predicted DNA-binding helix-hairpin-helix protein